MRFFSFVSCTLAVVARAQNLSSFAGDVQFPPIPDVDCADGLQMFISRGTNEPAGAGKPGELGDAIAARIPGANITATPYPATFENPSYFVSVGIGTWALQQLLTRYLSKCPGSKVAVIGYSQGAQVSSNVFCGSATLWGAASPLSADLYGESLVAVALFGDPTFKVDEPFSRGSSQHTGVCVRASGTSVHR